MRREVANFLEFSAAARLDADERPLFPVLVSCHVLLETFLTLEHAFANRTRKVASVRLEVNNVITVGLQLQLTNHAKRSKILKSHLVNFLEMNFHLLSAR